MYKAKHSRLVCARYSYRAPKPGKTHTETPGPSDPMGVVSYFQSLRSRCGHTGTKSGPLQTSDRCGATFRSSPLLFFEDITSSFWPAVQGKSEKEREKKKIKPGHPFLLFGNTQQQQLDYNPLTSWPPLPPRLTHTHRTRTKSPHDISLRC